MDVENLALKYALDNARKYGGKPNIGSVVGSIIAKEPKIKSDLKRFMPKIQEVCKKVSKMSVDEQIRMLSKIAPELLEEKKVVQERTLKDLKNAEQGKVVLRLAPSPSGPNHIGHALVFTLNYLYKKKYDGKLILRIEDTNPDNIYEPAYKMIEEDWKWLTQDGIDEVVVQSNRMETYYDYMHEILERSGAYVCTCNADKFRELIHKKQACPCRDLDIKEQLLRWDRMFVELEPGDAVVRIKTDIAHPNPAMRDWAAFRINHRTHPLTGSKYRVWPLMNFAVAIDDHELGITHTIRGKDHMDNAKRQQYIYDFFGWTAPERVFIGKINFEGFKVKTSLVKKDIERGVYSGWDDIRLPFLAALRRRGFQPQAFHSFAMDVGLGLNDKVVPLDDFFKSIEAHNRKVIDPVANRYFFIPDPVLVRVEGAPDKRIRLKLHPDDPERGFRELSTSSSIFVPKADLERMEEGGLYRLMDFCNVEKKGASLVFVSESLDEYRKRGKGSMQWLPETEDLLDVQVLLPNGSLVNGKGEPALKNEKVGSIVQFERFAFCRLDSTDGSLSFWFTHK
ncbi:glutamate--tRNA ligase [Candidatus Woesearchaeota archaeon]|nr:MAG: glutamate--tRNA ligase [Candidatus Woesearchaeota archaeon]